MTHSITKIIYI